MKKILSTIAIFLLVLSGCNIQKIAEASNQNSEKISIETVFCPEENCLAFFISKIDTAETTLRCALYDLDNDQLIEYFKQKNNEVELQLIIDKRNYEEQITGNNVKIATPRQYMHNKFCIMDGGAIITGSTNPTENGFLFNDNNIIYIQSKTIANNYGDEFSELWQGIYGSGRPTKKQKIEIADTVIENYFCPEDNCKEHVLRTLNTAEKSIYFMTFSFTDEDIADVLITKDIEVKGIMEKRNINGMGSQFHRLKDFGINIISDTNKKSMHHKVFIVDNRTVITGSYNPTKSGNVRNDENILIIKNEQIAKRYLMEFDRIVP